LFDNYCLDHLKGMKKVKIKWAALKLSNICLDVWLNVKAVVRIAYSYQKEKKRDK
jgi:hypothetical protein